MAKHSVELPISSKPSDLELKKLKEYFKEIRKDLECKLIRGR